MGYSVSIFHSSNKESNNIASKTKLYPGFTIDLCQLFWQETMIQLSASAYSFVQPLVALENLARLQAPFLPNLGTLSSPLFPFHTYTFSCSFMNTLISVSQ
jgi:hypothetical protein